MAIPRGRASYAKKIVEPLVPTPKGGPHSEICLRDLVYRGARPAPSHPLARGAFSEEELLGEQELRTKYAK